MGIYTGIVHTVDTGMSEVLNSGQAPKSRGAHRFGGRGRGHGANGPKLFSCRHQVSFTSDKMLRMECSWSACIWCHRSRLWRCIFDSLCMSVDESSNYLATLPISKRSLSFHVDGATAGVSASPSPPTLCCGRKCGFGASSGAALS